MPSCRFAHSAIRISDRRSAYARRGQPAHGSASTNSASTHIAAGLLRIPLASVPLFCLLGAWLAVWPGTLAMADIVVIANRTDRDVPFALRVANQETSEHRVSPGASLAVPTVGGPIIGFRSGDSARRFQLEANRAYAFDWTTDQKLELKQIDLAGDAVSAKGTGVAGTRPATGELEIPVRIYVDDDETALDAQWRARLARRVAEASAILQRECRVRLRVAGFGKWNSSDSAADFEAGWDEFQREVSRPAGSLVLGFTSQYSAEAGADEAPDQGLRRGLLRPHILIREGGSRLSEAEKLEVLVHALGHYLGAFQSDRENSVMRPLAGDGKARRATFRIGFDPANHLAVNLVAEELRVRKVESAEDLTTSTRLRLRQIYSKIPRPVATEVASTGPAPSADDFTKDAPRHRPGQGHRPQEGTDADDLDRGLDPRLDRRPARVEHDQVLLQGRWEVASAQLSGQATRKLTGNEAVFEGDRLTVKLPRFGTLRFRFKLTPGPTGNKMTVTHLSEPGKAPGGLAILNQFRNALSQESRYRLQGDTLTTSFVLRGFPLPEDIKKQLGNGRVQIVLKRVPEEDAAARRDPRVRPAPPQ